MTTTNSEQVVRECAFDIMNIVKKHNGDNAGLVVAEIELRTEDQPFSRPPWLGREVTHDSRYFNSSLATHPYSKWREPHSGRP